MIARVGVAFVVAQVVWGQSQAEIRKAVDRALPVLQRSAAMFVEKRACVSCHHNDLAILMLHEARNRGVAIDQAVLSAVEEKTFKSLSGQKALDDAIQGVNVNDPTPNDSLLLMAAEAAEIAPGLTTTVIARRMASWQRDGHWVTSDFRPPHSSSYFMTTATAVRAIQAYLPGSDAAIREARRWLKETRPVSTEDASFRLMGLKWAGSDAGEIAAARRDLIAMQKPNGGWAQTANYLSDAYSTGEAVYALGAPEDAAVRRGLRFLISSQASDGTWRVRTRMLSPADVSPKYFTTGFPYQKDEYLSYAGSVWGVMGLLSAVSAPGGTESRGLKSPTPRVSRGSEACSTCSALMMVVTEPEKVRALLKGGAVATAEDLTVACSYRGTGETVKLLLDAGVKPKARALVLASMTGDLEIVKLLLAHGADPSAAAGNNTPLSQAATFGYPEVARTLIAAGASAGIRDSNGVNLLHWAAITDRPQMIPVLVQAGVGINEVDDFGYTPMMYAATIDFGDTELVAALLRNGASTAIPNGEGLTPLQQARKLKLRHIETALHQAARD